MTFIFRFRIEADRPVSTRVPALTQRQGSKEGAKSQAARFSNRAVDDNRTCSCACRCRSSRCGPAKTIRRRSVVPAAQVGNRTFAVPLFDPGRLAGDLKAPAGDPKARGVPRAGSHQLELPYKRGSDAGRAGTPAGFQFRMT